MSVDADPMPVLPTVTEVRNANGEWRPPYTIEYAPLFQWPWRPLAALKWLVSYPGFALPNNLLMLVIAALSYVLTQPALARCVTFQWDWMLWIWVRNQALIWMVYGTYYLWLYIWKKEGTRGKYDVRWPTRNSRVFLFRDQVYDNIFWTAGVAGLIWSALEWVTLWMYANGKLPYLGWSDATLADGTVVAGHPVWFVVWMVAIPFWREFHFYWIHRFLHWMPVYKRVHYLHHKNFNPNPWSGLAMHPIEVLAYLSVSWIHWIVPSHPFHFLFTLQHAALVPASGHDGFEGPLVHNRFPAGSYFHYLHHRYFECNYGETMLPLDKWFGTFRDGASGATDSRSTAKQMQGGDG